MSAETGSSPAASERTRPPLGIVAAVLINVLWAAHLAYALLILQLPETANIFWFLRIAVHMGIQGYLYTGLFITAHDAMHGVVSPNRRVNRLMGRLSAFLFAAFSYTRLHRNHMNHHRWPGGDRDPDFYPRSQNFFVWFVVFFWRYASVIQLVIMAVVFNLLRLVAPTWNIILFWIVPAFLGTLQLFYFGTYRPHRYPHTNEMGTHRARSQRRNHVMAMLTCYFFGYHLEHHKSPGTPWWRLYAIKNRDG